MLNKSTSKKINAWKLTLVLPFLAVFLWSFNINEVVTYSDSSTSDSEFTSSSSTSERINLTSEEVSNNAIRNVIPKDNSNPLIEETPIVVANSSNRTTRKSLAITSEKNLSNISEIALKEAMITITKNTTKMELKAMKSKLKSKGVSFDYSNLVYTDSNEIIAISINYKSNKGNSGSYSVNSDTPINTIVIKKDGDRVSVQSNGSHNHSYSSDESIEMSRARREEQQERLERHQEEMENRKGDMKERQEEMELRQEEMLERQVEAEGRRAEAQHRMEERRAEIQERQLEIYKAQKEISEHHDVFISEGGSSDNHGVHIIRDSDGGLFEIQDTHHGANDVIIVDRIIENGAGYSERQHSTSYSRSLKRITKNSTKSDLENLKTSYDSKGISFSYSGVKRNNAGEITKIRLKIKDNKGSSSSSSYNGDGKAIEDIFIDTDNGITIMKGGSH